MKATPPSEPGWYWARWLRKASGTRDADFDPDDEWEVVNVLEDHVDRNGEIQFAVLVCGVEKMQFPWDFEWGGRVKFCDAPLSVRDAINP